MHVNSVPGRDTAGREGFCDADVESAGEVWFMHIICRSRSAAAVALHVLLYGDSDMYAACC